MNDENLPIKYDPPVNKGTVREIWFLHGANASPNSFNYIKEILEQDKMFEETLFTDISYNCQDKLHEIVKVLTISAPRDKDLYIIGHSLGGVLAAAIAQRVIYHKVPVSLKGIITMGSPFGGSESADYLRWLYPSYHLFKSISTDSRLIKDLQANGAVVPTLSLVTSSGNNPLIPYANDGVVSIKSQRALPGAEYVEVPFNHFEVLVSEDTPNRIKSFMINN